MSAGRGDRGSTELLFSLPLAFLLLMLVVQVAMWAHAQHRAQAITEQTMAATRAADATTVTGHARATAAVADLGGALLRDVDVEVERSATTATVRLDAHIQGLVPGWNPSVHTDLSAPVERVEVQE